MQPLVGKKYRQMSTKKRVVRRSGVNVFILNPIGPQRKSLQDRTINRQSTMEIPRLVEKPF